MKHIQTYEGFLNESTSIFSDSTDKQITLNSEIELLDGRKAKVLAIPDKTNPKYKKGIIVVSAEKGGNIQIDINKDIKNVINEGKKELGLYVTGSTSYDNTKIGKWLDKSIFHAEWNARDGYWLFPADDESEYDELEKELDKEFAKHGINARFEGIFESLVNEKMDVNDPILVAIRAAKEDRKKSAAAQAVIMKKRVYGKQREKLENDLFDIAQDLKDLYSDKRSVLTDMESEAGEKGNDWSDDDANRYGEELNKIDDKIEALLIKRQELEIKLAY